MKGEAKLAFGCSALLGLVALIMLGFTIADINRVNRMKETSCTVTAVTLGQDLCCSKSCTGCSECPFGAPSCNSALQDKEEGPCCDGYECCHKTCHKCCGGGTSCTTKLCDCECDSSVNQQECRINCDTCYTPQATMEYTPRDTTQKEDGIIEENCGTSLNCAEEFVAQFPVNSTHGCYYDPNDLDVVRLNNDPNSGLRIVNGIFGGLSVLSAVGGCVVNNG